MNRCVVTATACEAGWPWIPNGAVSPSQIGAYSRYRSCSHGVSAAAIRFAWTPNKSSGLSARKTHSSLPVDCQSDDVMQLLWSESKRTLAHSSAGSLPCTQEGLPPGVAGLRAHTAKVAVGRDARNACRSPCDGETTTENGVCAESLLVLSAVEST